MCILAKASICGKMFEYPEEDRTADQFFVRLTRGDPSYDLGTGAKGLTFSCMQISHDGYLQQTANDSVITQSSLVVAFLLHFFQLNFEERYM